MSIPQIEAVRFLWSFRSQPAAPGGRCDAILKITSFARAVLEQAFSWPVYMALCLPDDEASENYVLLALIFCSSSTMFPPVILTPLADPSFCPRAQGKLQYLPFFAWKFLPLLLSTNHQRTTNRVATARTVRTTVFGSENICQKPIDRTGSEQLFRGDYFARRRPMKK